MSLLRQVIPFLQFNMYVHIYKSVLQRVVSTDIKVCRLSIFEFQFHTAYFTYAVSRENLSLGFLTRASSNWVVQPQKMARGLKFRIKEVKGLYYLCSENKGADQLCGHHAADLCLCLCICKSQVFS